MTFGMRHFMILTKEGVVFAVGDNEFGQLGITPGQTVKVVQSPQHCDPLNQICVVTSFVESGLKVKDVTCGDNFTLFLTSGDNQAVFIAGQMPTEQLNGNTWSGGFGGSQRH